MAPFYVLALRYGFVCMAEEVPDHELREEEDEEEEEEKAGREDKMGPD